MNVIVTGATGAIGKEIARGIAAKGDTPFIACRNADKGQAVADEIKASFGIVSPVIALDLSDSQSVREAVRQLAPIRFDGIVNNAGVMNSCLKTDHDGNEDTVNVNYRNTRLFSELMLPKVNKGGRIVFTTSATRTWFPFQNLKKESLGPFRRYNRLWVYARSKKLITKYARELAQTLKEKGIRVNCADPGVVDSPMLKMNSWIDKLTDIFFRPFCLKPKTGAKAALRALYSTHTGRIFMAPFGSTPNNRWF